VRSFTTAAFRKCFANLPADVRAQARRAYALFCADPFHPSLHFKQVKDDPVVFSARVGRSHRALGVRDRDEIVWFWVGTHAEYDAIV
jgi:hypothetical protein